MKKTADNRHQVEYDYAFTTPGFPLAVRLEENATATAEHMHENFSELVIVLSGSATHSTADRKYQLVAGDIFVIGERQLHSYSNTVNFCYCNVVMDWQKMKLPLNDLPTRPGYQTLFVIDRQDTTADRFDNRFRLNAEQLKTVTQMLHKLDQLQNDHHFEAIGQFMLLVGYLCDCCSQREKSIPNLPQSLGHLVAKMEKHSERSYSINSMCREVGMSRATFFRSFINYYGMPPLEYLIQLRIKRSMQLLAETNLSCGEIALRCGFSNSSYFALHFRRQTGSTPNAYRKTWRHNVEITS